MSKSIRRFCLCCRKLLRPDARNRGRQKYCSAPACRKASKAASQQRWLSKPANQDYFKGSANVERVQQWRKGNPHYWKRRSEAKSTLQEVLNAEGADQQSVRPKTSQSALQDLLTAQGPMLLGLISQLIDTPLQENIEQTAYRLVSRGLSVLGMKPGAKPKGNDENQETGALSAATAAGATTVQLDRSAVGPSREMSGQLLPTGSLPDPGHGL